jgi:hypothetical protein
MLAESLISQGGKTGDGIFLRNDRSDFLAGELLLGETWPRLKKVTG